MLRISCPYCGDRDETEFRYKGAAIPRPDGDAGLDAFTAFVYERDNVCGWHHEWWLHVAGCRRLLTVTRHTQSHEIRSVAAAFEPSV